MGTLTAQGDPQPTGVGLGIGPPQFRLRTGTPKLTTVGTPTAHPKLVGCILPPPPPPLGRHRNGRQQAETTELTLLVVFLFSNCRFKVYN